MHNVHVVEIVQVSCHLHHPLWLWNMDPVWWLKKKTSRPLKPSAWGNFSASPTWSTRPTTGCGTRSTSLWVCRNHFWQLSRDGNLHGSGMSRTMAISPKPSFRAPWRVNKAMVGRGNAGGTTSNSGHPFLCQNCSQWPVAEKTGRRSLPNRFSCRSRDKTELYHVVDSTLCSYFILLCMWWHIVFPLYISL